MGLRSGFQDRKKAIALYWFLALAQIALAITILVIIADDLWHYTGYYFYSPYYNTYFNAAYGVCLFKTDWLSDSTSPCWYFYWVAAWSIFASMFMACAVATTVDDNDRSCNCCRLGFSIFMWCWWVVGASVMTADAHYADNANAPNSYWRHVVVGLAWGQVLAFTLTLLIDIKIGAEPARPRLPPTEPPVAPVQYGVDGTTKQTELPAV